MGIDAGKRSSIACSIAPLLSVRGGARAVEFYKSAFGAIEVYRVEDPSGAVVSRLSIDGAEFWLSDESVSSWSYFRGVRHVAG
jgi:PhnB protein